jgi:hypothetical protein
MRTPAATTTKNAKITRIYTASVDMIGHLPGRRTFSAVSQASAAAPQDAVKSGGRPLKDV